MSSSSPPNHNPDSNTPTITPTTAESTAAQAAHTPSSTPSTAAASSLPPEAIALAGRMFEAARSGGDSGEALLKAALERGLPPNLTNDKGDTLIMLAAYHGHAALVRLLLSHGADPNRLNDRGQSPLAGVVFKNERECVDLLLEGGADPELGSPSALDSCRVFRQEELEARFREQVGRLRSVGGSAVGDRSGNGNGNGVVHAHGDENGHMNGDS